GELADPTGRKTLSPVLALVPIVRLRMGLDLVESWLKLNTTEGWQRALEVLSSSAYSAKEIKRQFNRYSDNIYIEVGSARANAYLDGGAMPTSKETTQYLLRNEVLAHVDELTAELAYLLRDGGGVGGGDTADLYTYLSAAKKSFDDYLQLAPPLDLDGAAEVARAKQPSFK
ncbi:hypothetical protein JKP88DRAFT_178439, partial [Tribonema minus]